MDSEKKRERMEEKRRRILDGAIRSFCEKGVEFSTVDDICKKTGCSHGLFYHYYQNKEELLSDLLSKWDNEIMYYANDLLSTAATPTEKYEKLTEYILHSAETKEMFAYRCYFFVTEVFRLTRNGAAKKKSPCRPESGGEKLVPLSAVYGEIFAEGQQSGEFPITYSPEIYAKLTMDFITGEILDIILSEGKRERQTPIGADVIRNVLLSKETV